MMAAGVALSNFDQNIGGAVSGTGSIILGLAKMPTDPFGGIITAGLGVIQLFKTLRD